MRAILTLVMLVALLAPPAARGDAGVLIPSNRQQPDPAILSMEEMAIDIWMDNGEARVLVRQIFASHWGSPLEGNYIFALPGRATVSDFAVWDGVTRIPGVILERRRAEEIYSSLRWQTLDPGLLQMGERGEDEARRSAVFSARVMPIPAWGTKRIEIEYHERIPAEDLKSFFAIPLKPDAYKAQTVGHLWITLELRSAHALKDFEALGKTYPLEIRERTPNLVKASLELRNVTLSEDFALRYSLDPSRADTLEILRHRNPAPAQLPPTERAPAPPAPAEEPGYFQASALLALGEGPFAPAAAVAAANQRGSAGGRTPALGAGSAGASLDVASAPRTVVALFDASLSMQWEKLERSFQALEALLRSLRPADRFNLLLFNTEVTSFAPAPVAADLAAVEKALAFVRSSRLRGGTNLELALDRALAQAPASRGEPYLVLLSDGGATRGVIQNARLASGFAAKWKKAPDAGRPRTYVFAVGDDANMPLLRMLAEQNGVVEWVRSTEPMEFKLNAFLSKIGRRPLEGLRLGAAPEGNFDLIYPLEPNWFSGSLASWVGQYRKPAPQAAFTVRGARDGRPVEIRAAAALPAQSLEHPSLPRTWAQARVQALLEKIEREGEDRATVDEIIRLARKYKFVTPYTSFLAVPRALLRPRVIRPGDPVLRVKTDPSIVSVVALFPFGLVKKLRYLHEEDVWQTRFLAPSDMADGTYSVRLVLRDQAGRVYRESKSFVIASRPPVVRVRLEKTRFRRGETVRLRVSASESTRTVVARMYGVPPAYLRWNAQAASNTGDLTLPDFLPAGRYVLTVTAEDVAHNIGSQEVPIEVLP